jgi:hypothetical protein
MNGCPLVTCFDPDQQVASDRLERAAVALFAEFIRDPANAYRRWVRVPEVQKDRYRREAAAVAAALEA